MVEETAFRREIAVKRIAFVAILLVGAVGVYLAWAGFTAKRGRAADPQSSPSITEGSFVKGLHYRVHDNGSLISEADAEDLRIVPKSFFVFKVKSISEAVVTNAKINLYKLNESRKDPGDDLFRAMVKEVSEGELIVKAVANGIEVNFYDETEKVTHHLKAARADLVAGPAQTVFYNATLENPPSRTIIRTEKLFWNAKEKKFKVPGQYITFYRGGEIKGNGLQIDMNFKMKKLKHV